MLYNIKIIVPIIFQVSAWTVVFGNPQGDTSKSAYVKALDEITTSLSNNTPSFKRAVFLTESAYFDDTLSYVEFENKIQYLVFWARQQARAISLPFYKQSDSDLVKKNMAIFMVLEDTCWLNASPTEVHYHIPFTYDFDDFFGKDRWTKMFVTKLLVTQKGNCHSLPYLYKIIADELGIPNAWLSFAPNHIYIRNRCKKIGWYNTELTSGQFPVDAWIMASGYVSTDAIRSGIYMDTVSNQQAIANCALDLAKGYERKYKIYTDSFIVKCCDLTLKYHPTNINAIIYKAETLKKIYFICQKENPVLAMAVYADMEKLYVRALDLGYKQMPEKMYEEWILSVAQQKEKYSNKRVKETIKIGNPLNN